MWNPNYDFLDPTHRIKRFELPGTEYQDAEVIVVLDTGTWGQLGDFATFVKSSSAQKVVIDHHLSRDDLAPWNCATPPPRQPAAWSMS